jgi:hypothetical protein
MSLTTSSDSGGDFFFSGLYYDPMPTSIVRINTLDGIVVAADGRSVNEKDEVVSKEVQKLFPIPFSAGSCVVGISGAGSACFENDKGEELELEYGALCQVTAEAFRDKAFSDFSILTTAFSETLKQNMQERVRYGIQKNIVLKQDLEQWFESQKQEQGVTLHYAGISQGTHWFATSRIIFDSLDPVVTPRELTDVPSHKSMWRCLGSEPVETALRNISPEFTAFRTPGLLKFFREEALSLAEGIDAARSYIEACSSTQADELHSFCKKIGGHIHIATLTISDGFRWGEPPITQPSQTHDQFHLVH